MSSLRDRAEQHIAVIGRLGVAGIGCMVGASIFAYTAVLPTYQELWLERERLARITKRGTAAPAVTPKHETSIDDTLAGFTANFPERNQARAQLLQLHAVAAKHELVLRRADYRVSDDLANGLTRHQVSVPLKGTYRGARAFLADINEMMPTLAQDALSIKRETGSLSELEGTVSFTLYTRSQ